MKKVILNILTVLTLVLVTNLSYGPPPPPPNSTPTCWPPPCIPMDNGLKFVLIGAFLFGVYMIVKLKRKTEKAD